MREADLLEQLDVVTTADANGGGGPFADAVHGHDGCLLERRGEEGAGGVALVVAGEEDGAAIPAVQAPADLAGQVQLLPEPDGDRLAEAGETVRRIRHVCLEQPFEF